MSVPDTWSVCLLEDVVEVHDDLRQPVNAKERSQRVGDYPYYGATGQVGWIDDYLMDGEYILLGEDGAPFLDPTKPKAYRVEGRAWVNNHAHVLRGIEGLLANRFLLHALNCTDYREFANGTTRLKLTQGAMRRIPLPVPPLPEQHRIVEKIEELFSDLDAGVASLQRAKANLKRYRASVLKSAVEGRLTEEWRKEHLQAEDGAFLEDNWVPLEEVITLLGQGWSPKCESAAATDDAEWAVIKTSAIQSMAFVPDENKQLPDTLTPRPELVIEPGDLLITRAGPRSRAGVTCLVRHTRPRLILCDKAYRVRFDETRALPAFVEVVLNAPNFLDRLDELKTGISDSGVNLTQKKFVDLAIPLPPLAEQEQIVALVEERLSQIDSAEKTIDAELIRSKRLRQSILKRAFEGKLVPQDPNDKPASVLLERIKASREAEQPKKKAKKAKKVKAK